MGPAAEPQQQWPEPWRDHSSSSSSSSAVRRRLCFGAIVLFGVLVHQGSKHTAAVRSDTFHATDDWKQKASELSATLAEMSAEIDRQMNHVQRDMSNSRQQLMESMAHVHVHVQPQMRLLQELLDDKEDHAKDNAQRSKQVVSTQRKHRGERERLDALRTRMRMRHKTLVAALRDLQQHAAQAQRDVKGVQQEILASEARGDNVDALRTRMRTGYDTVSAALHDLQQHVTEAQQDAKGVQQDVLASEVRLDSVGTCANGTVDAKGTCIRQNPGVADNLKSMSAMKLVEREDLKTRLKLWAKVVNGAALRYACRNASVPKRIMHKMRRSGYGTRDADSWHVCYDGWTPVGGCTGISIGIGGEWGFEDGLSQSIGCHVHAYDPTEELASGHMKHANEVSHRFHGRLQFEPVGLGGEAAQFNTGSKRYGHFDPSKSQIRTLGAIMAGAKPTGIVDVLKIDCEGCEWVAFREVERRQPNLLSRVRIIMLEVHSIQRYGLEKVAQVDRLLSFFINTHGFRVYRSSFNKGWPGARNQIAAPLYEAGFPRLPCCWNLHLMRPPENDTWIRAAIGALT